MKVFALFLATLVSSATAIAQYGYGPGYPYPGHGGYDFPAPAPFASAGYQYVTSGFSRPHSLGHVQTPQFSIAKVKSHSNPLGYQYSVHESGPFHHKYHHQTASTQPHFPGYPVITAAGPVHVGIPLAGYAPGIPSYPYGSNHHIPSKAVGSHHGPTHPGYAPGIPAYSYGQFPPKAVQHGPGGYYGNPPEGIYGGYPGGISLSGGGPVGGSGLPMYGPEYGF